MWIVNLALRRP
jgi:multidrug efflux pump subunit AcrB